MCILFLEFCVQLCGSCYERSNVGVLKSAPTGIYTVSGKKHPEHYRLSLKEMSTNFNIFWYKYFWRNWPSNDWPIYHLTECLPLHYLGKINQRNMR